jgi:hypothetical protein
MLGDEERLKTIKEDVLTVQTPPQASGRQRAWRYASAGLHHPLSASPVELGL